MKTRFSLGVVIMAVAALSFLTVGYATAGWREQLQTDREWVGEDINVIIRVWGPPTSVYTSPNGEQTFSWVTVNGTTVTGKVTRELFGPSVNVESQSHENSCRKSFVVGATKPSIGLVLDPNGPNKEHDVVVFKVNTGMPAQQAGVQAGDVILAINGESTKDINANNKSKVFGLWYTSNRLLYRLVSEGAQISLTLKHKKSKETFTVTLASAVAMKDRALSYNYQGACYQ